VKKTCNTSLPECGLFCLFLLACIKWTKGFHSCTSICEYNVLWSLFSPLAGSYSSSPSCFSKNNCYWVSPFYFHISIYKDFNHIYLRNPTPTDSFSPNSSLSFIQVYLWNLKGSMQYLAFWVWIISLNMVISNFIHVPAKDITSFLFINQKIYNILHDMWLIWMIYLTFIYWVIN
jgi:hypothetical protein